MEEEYKLRGKVHAPFGPMIMEIKYLQVIKNLNN